MKASLNLADEARRDLGALPRTDTPSVRSIRRRYSKLLVRARGGTGDARRTLRVCRLLLGDSDDMVVKAMSWSLRELAKQDQKVVEAFLLTEEDRLSSRVKREVLNKLTTGLKSPRRRTPSGATKVAR